MGTNRGGWDGMGIERIERVERIELIEKNDGKIRR
jgi:hypothetical protein